MTTTLPSDQHAALQLVLEHGLSYDRLGAMLRTEPGTVRERVQAGVSALIDAESSVARPPRDDVIVDYLVGQQTGEQREATMRWLAGDVEACAWAHDVAAAMRAAGRDPVVFVPRPELAVGNPVLPAGADLADVTVPMMAIATPVARTAARTGQIEASDPRAGRTPVDRVTIVGVLLAVAAAIGIALVLLNGGDQTSFDPPKVATPAAPATTTPAVRAPAAKTPVRPRLPTAKTVIAKGGVAHQITLIPAQAKGSASGSASVIPDAGNGVLTVTAQGLTVTANAALAVWLTNARKRSKLLGFVATTLDSKQGFTAGVKLPADAARYTSVLVTQERTAAPAQPGAPVLTGAFALK